MKHIHYRIISIFVLVFVCSPMFVSAATLQFSGWVPFWRKTAGVADAVAHIDQLNTVSPFAYHVDKNGKLLDDAKLQSAPWDTLVNAAGGKKIAVIPTILWGDKTIMEDILTNKKLRMQHINDISKKILNDSRFAGVDIDYEAKSVATRDDFSLFLKTLSVRTRARNKQLVCTIEPRTPIEDKVTVVNEELLDSIEYSNDYTVIGKVCDVVRIMTYDQGAIDIKLNSVKKGINYYAPVADPIWVAKVIETALVDIPAKKIELGVATYGYMYELTPNLAGGFSYKRIKALNYPAAVKLATEHNTVLTRNSAGEMSASYISDAVVLPNQAQKTILLWVSDSVAIADKIALAKQYKLRGVAVFKIDGENDGKLWDVLKN
jgi:spore germination protein YaaH